MLPESGGMPRGCPLLGGATCPHAVSRVDSMKVSRTWSGHHMTPCTNVSISSGASLSACRAVSGAAPPSCCEKQQQRSHPAARPGLVPARPKFCTGHFLHVCRFVSGAFLSTCRAVSGVAPPLCYEQGREPMAPRVDRNNIVTSGGASQISTGASKEMCWSRPIYM